MKSIYFWGACKQCELVMNIPFTARYICTSEGYDIYDSEEYEEKYYAVKCR